MTKLAVRFRSLGLAVVASLATGIAGVANGTELTLLNGWTHSPFSTSRAEAFLDDGIVHFKGAIGEGTSSHLFTLPAELRPAANVFVAVDLCGNTPGRLFIQSSGDVFVNVAGGDFTIAQCFISLDGARFAPSSTGFAPLSLLNGWTAAPAGTSSPSASIIDNVVHLKGAMSSGTSSIAFTLPLELRPPTDVFVNVGLCNAAKGRLRIQPSGVVSVSAPGPFSDAQCFTSLDGVAFAGISLGFTALALENGWTNAPFSTSGAAFDVKDGIVVLKGAIGSGTSSRIFTLPIGVRPKTDVFVPIDLCGGSKGRLQIQATGAVFVDGSFTQAQCFTSLDGASFVLPPPTEWTPLTPFNSWTGNVFGAGAPAVVFYDGIVHLRGAVAAGSTDVISRLPVALRPDHRVFVPTDLYQARRGRLQIDPTNGEIIVSASENFTFAQNFTSLAGVTFALTGSGFTPLALPPGASLTPFGSSAPSVAKIDGLVHLQGGMIGAAPGLITTLPVGMRPAQNVRVSVALCDAVKGRIQIAPDGAVTAEGNAVSMSCLLSFDGAKFAPAAAGFSSLPLTNGWQSPSFGSATAAATMIRDVVYLRGAIEAGADGYVATLPPALRPPVPSYVAADLCNNTPGRVIVLTTGDLFVQDLTGSGLTNAKCFTSLDGVAYAVPEPTGSAAVLACALMLLGLSRSRPCGRHRAVA